MRVHSHFGVYAFIEDERGESLLLVRKGRGPYQGLLDLPGGTPERDELEEITLRREVREETGCEVVSAEKIGTFELAYPYADHGEQVEFRHRGALYRAQISGTIRTNADGHDSLGCVWQRVHEMSAEIASPAVAAAIEIAFRDTPYRHTP